VAVAATSAVIGSRPWWDVLDVDPDEADPDVINRHWRIYTAALAEFEEERLLLNLARDAALTAIGAKPARPLIADG
jgi:hypothetical protein